MVEASIFESRVSASSQRPIVLYDQVLQFQHQSFAVLLHAVVAKSFIVFVPRTVKQSFDYTVRCILETSAKKFQCF